MPTIDITSLPSPEVLASLLDASKQARLREVAEVLDGRKLIGLHKFSSRMMQGYKKAGHLLLLDEALKEVSDGTCRRLIITMPPRHGKSLKTSIHFPAWYLGQHPNRRVVVSSYAADLAHRFSRQVRNIVDSREFQDLFPGVKVDPTSRSAEAWDLARNTGGMKAVGVGGPLTGHGANLLLIDDPIKNREESQSALIRQNIWDWYTSTAYTRLEDNAAVVAIMTRWHEDDLVGRLIGAQSLPGADQWRILHLPAIDDTGKALWPEKYSLDDLESIKANIGAYDWETLYQGRPTPREGAFFQVSKIRVVDELPKILKSCRAWDLASTQAGGDWTAGVKVSGPDDNGLWYVTDVRRGQWSTDERNRTMRVTTEADGRSTVIRLAQDPGQAGKDQVQSLIRMLAGYIVRAYRATGSKETRADAFSAQVNAGNVRLLKADWNAAYVEELRAFPFGKHDDQIDGSADGFTELAQKRMGRAA